MKRIYIDPSVKLINSSEGYVGFFLWMKSRQEVITDLSGFHFMKDCQLTNNWYWQLPKEFIVGGETVQRDEYYHRIDRMNLQYNNGEYMLFEINGSCLFRDICYNFDGTAQWAESNRFLFSILGEQARFESENYKISAEYKDIPEWEAQFDTYMQAIKDDPIVDHNRIEMPYSISSRFWWGCNRRQLRAFLGFLKYEAPFFYEVYGTMLMNESDVEADMLSPDRDSLIDQHMLPTDFDHKEKVQKVYKDYYVSTKMGLILFSQFARQAGSCISGYYDILKHTDVEVFKHKVYKGGTIFDILYRAPIKKVEKTVQTRLCAFAMSSGNDPCSWSYFLNHFIPMNIRPMELMNMLPCSFKNGKLTNCKFHDDIKFRNEGKEISNCPCPLVSLSMKDAETKRTRDNNRIGDAFYDLTEYIINDGFPTVIQDNIWTSDLAVYIDRRCDENKIKDYIKLLDSVLESKWIRAKKASINSDTDLDQYADLLGDEFKYDITCLMKGYFIDCLKEFLTDKMEIDSFIINFGGDIYLHGVTDKVIQLPNSKYQVKVSGNYSIFTSGNTSKRGNHINGCAEGRQVSVICEWNSYRCNNTIIDLMTTKKAAKEYDVVNTIKNSIPSADIIYLEFQDGMLTNKTYCASPFFNPKQVEVRDNMISTIVDPFRPDLTDSSKKFDEGDNDIVDEVVNDNIKGIIDSELLVFPKNTDDIGTLFEVGVAMAEGIPIIAYDDVKDIYTLIKTNVNLKLAPHDTDYVFDCSTRAGAVSIGYASMKVDDDNIYYMLKGAKDNIMLSTFYTHVELINGKYNVLKRDPNDRDREL